MNYTAPTVVPTFHSSWTEMTNRSTAGDSGSSLAYNSTINCLTDSTTDAAINRTMNTTAAFNTTLSPAFDALGTEMTNWSTPEISGNQGIYNNTTNCLTESTTPAVIYQGEIGFGELEKYPELWAAFYINQYYLKVIAGLGIPGNVLSFVIIFLLRPLSSFSIYVATLAAADTLTLVIKLIYLESTRWGYDMGLYGCKFFIFSASVCPMYSFWTLVIMTVERTIAVFFPLQVNRYCTKKSAVICLCICFVGLVGFNGFIFDAIIKSQTSINAAYCVYSDEYKDFITGTWFWVDGTFSTAIPCVILLVCNIAVITKLRQNSKLRRQMSQKGAQKSKQTQMTVMLVVVSVVFILLTMPFTIFLILEPKLDFGTPNRRTAWNWLIKQLVYLMFESNHAINFYLYCISGQKFRHKFFELLCCRKRAASTYAPSTNRQNTAT